MQITITDQAIQRLTHVAKPGADFLKLVYDIEGCGCAVDGVPVLWITSEAGEDELTAAQSPFHVVYDKRQEVFFEDRLKLDYRAGSRTFILSSANQIYHHNLSIVDKRNNHVQEGEMNHA